MIKIIPPNRNLGCLGFCFGRLYADVYKKPHLGLYLSITNFTRIWINFKGLKYEGNLGVISILFTTKEKARMLCRGKRFIYRRW